MSTAIADLERRFAERGMEVIAGGTAEMIDRSLALRAADEASGATAPEEHPDDDDYCATLGRG